MGGVRSRGLVVVVLVAALLATSCSSGGDRATKPAPGRASVTTTTLPPRALPRYHRSGLRLTTSPQQPLAIYNVYPSRSQPELIRQVVDLWPRDLLPYLAIQIIISGTDELPQAEQEAALDAMLDASDAAKVPVIVQTLTFSGPKGPGAAAIDRAFDEHPSLVGVGIAEMSADYQTSLSGLRAEQKDQIAERLEQAARHDAVLLWADMGYLGPQVFVDAAADERLAGLMHDHAENLIVQVKQNGLGRRFGSMSAAFGLYVAGFAGAWGINSEDWLWWEASLEQLGRPQVPGGLTAAGMVRSDVPTRARLTYPESLFGTEMLVVAAAGGTVFSIEAPWRGTIDPDGTGELSPAGTNVVFPVLRRLIGARLIPTRAQVQSRLRLAYQPTGRGDPGLATDRAFSGLYGPEGCTDDDRLVCAQRQWLPSTGRYGLIPTLPAVGADDVADTIATVVAPPAGSDGERQAIADAAGFPVGAKGDSWAVPAAGTGTWFVANPNENEQERSTFELPAVRAGGRRVVVGGDLGPQAFAMVDARSGLSLLVDNYRTDSDHLWEDDISEDDLADLAQDEVGDAEPETTTLRFRVGAGAARPSVAVRGQDGRVVTRWSAASGTLTVTFTHRGPVELAVR